jgi:aspartyl-tRNA(Asn)/glutamyl-tRNA(Gln) amidotransferase subunit A
VKDLFATKGVETTAASKILEGFKPPYRSTVTQKLWDAGAGMLGKLNLDQFAMGSSNESSAFGPVVSLGGAAAIRRRWRRAVRRAVLGGGGGALRLRPPAPAQAAPSASPPPSPALRASSHLWPLLALGHRGLCLLAGSGRADGAQ